MVYGHSNAALLGPNPKQPRENPHQQLSTTPIQGQVVLVRLVNPHPPSPRPWHPSCTTPPGRRWHSASMDSASFRPAHCARHRHRRCGPCAKLTLKKNQLLRQRHDFAEEYLKRNWRADLVYESRGGGDGPTHPARNEEHLQTPEQGFFFNDGGVQPPPTSPPFRVFRGAEENFWFKNQLAPKAPNFF